VIPHPFGYVAPDSVDGCVEALRDGGRVLAGGTWVLPEMSRAESRPARLVDLRRAGLGGIAPADGAVSIGAVSIGAMATYADLLASPDVAARTPLLRAMADEVTGGWALRNQATVGGSAAAARPQSDVPAALVASGAVARVAGPAGERRLPVAELFAGAMRTSLADGELICGFDVPSAEGTGQGYVKLKRGASSWPIATAAALLRLDEAGVCTAATLVLGGVAAAPVPVDVAPLLVGRVPDPTALAEAAALAGRSVVDPWDDLLAPAGYRAAVAAPVARRALTSALRDAAATDREAA
jgi:aerobic carbon-monoxide dehydrogenase medium subunit